MLDNKSQDGKKTHTHTGTQSLILQICCALTFGTIKSAHHFVSSRNDEVITVETYLHSTNKCLGPFMRCRTKQCIESTCTDWLANHLYWTIIRNSSHYRIRINSIIKQQIHNKHLHIFMFFFHIFLCTEGHGSEDVSLDDNRKTSPDSPLLHVAVVIKNNWVPND